MNLSPITPPIRKWSGVVHHTQILDQIPTVEDAKTILLYLSRQNGLGLVKRFEVPNNISLEKLYNRHPNLVGGGIIQGGDGARNLTWTASPYSGGNIEIRFSIDTSEPDQSPNDQFENPFELTFRLAVLTSSPQNIYKESFTLKFGGGETKNLFPGFIAIDFGNHSTVAAIDQNSNSPIKIIEKKTVFSVRSAKTELIGNQQGQSIELFGMHSNKDHFKRDSLRAIIGKASDPKWDADKDICANRSAKRLLADLDAQADIFSQNPNDIKIESRGEKIYFHTPSNPNGFFFVPKRIPAEVFLCEFFDYLSQTFVTSEDNSRIGSAKNLAITYPSTYTRWQIENLKNAYARAFLRHINQPLPSVSSPVNSISATDPFDRVLRSARSVVSQPKSRNSASSPQSGEDFLALLMDEASAAAYFIVSHLFREKDVFGIDGFKYLFPQGARILVVDIGAGTTDIICFDIRNQAEKNQLECNMVGRTGDQSFSGDFITSEIAKLIKAKIVYFSLKKDPEFAKSTATFANADVSNPLTDPVGFVGKVLEVFEAPGFIQKFKFMDTRLPQQKPNSDQRNRLRNLIASSEKLKTMISSPNLSDNKQDTFFTLNEIGINEIIFSSSESSNIPLANNIGDLRIHFDEINQLIHPTLEKLVNKINTFVLPLNRELTKDHKEPFHWREVTKVILAGKGSLFPEILSYFKAMIGVLDPDEQIQRLDQILGCSEGENSTAILKNCVALGACQALKDESQGTSINFSKRLDNVLPFDLYAKIEGVDQLLFHMSTPYDDIPRPEINAGRPVEQVKLYQKFQGEDAVQSYATFDFSEAVNQFSVEWDKETFQFICRPTGFGSIGVTAIYESPPYAKSPLWSGNL